MTPSSDTLRQILNLIFAPAMWISSSVPMVFDIGRSISEQSDSNNTLLVPAGIAFSIWFPIFVGCIAYAIIQVLPKNRERAIFRDIGWLTAGSFMLITLWGYMAAFPPPAVSAWGTALVFIPAVLLICAAVLKISPRRAELSAGEGYMIYIPLSLLAGWCSIAVFLNWAQLGVHGPIGFGLSEVIVCLLTLAAALAWITLMIHKTGGNRAYTFAPVWGLAFLVMARLSADDYNLTIAIAAGIGAVVLLGSALIAGRRAKV